MSRLPIGLKGDSPIKPRRLHFYEGLKMKRGEYVFRTVEKVCGKQRLYPKRPIVSDALQAEL